MFVVRPQKRYTELAKLVFSYRPKRKKNSGQKYEIPVLADSGIVEPLEHCCNNITSKKDISGTPNGKVPPGGFLFPRYRLKCEIGCKN